MYKYLRIDSNKLVLEVVESELNYQDFIKNFHPSLEYIQVDSSLDIRSSDIFLDNTNIIKGPYHN